MRLFHRTATVELSWRGYRALRRGGRRSTAVAIGLILFGITCFLPGVPAFLSKEDWLNDWMAADPVHGLCVIIGLCSIGAGASRLRLRMLLFRSRGLIAHDELSDQLAIDEETLDAVMRNRNIHPRLILNGQRFYKRSDFGDLPLLLRPSQAPALAEGILLRPVAGSYEAQTTNLLRPVTEETFDEVARVNSSTSSE